MVTKESILAKTHYGTGIYSHILRQFYPGQTVMHITGRDCGYCRNPWHCDEPTLHIWIEKLHPEQNLSEELSHHEDLMGYIEPGDCFDFAARYWELEGQPLLDKINEELCLHLEDGYCAYEYQKKYIKPTGPAFSLFDAPITNTVPAAEVHLRDIYALITSDEPREATRTLRSITDPGQKRMYKATHFRYATFSGTFTSRSDRDLKQHSGLICIDFDHLQHCDIIRARLLEDQYFDTQLLFTSPSGDGLKWIIPIDILISPHAEYFRAIAAYVHETYGIEADRSGKDISRACFLPYDPDAFLNPKYR